MYRPTINLKGMTMNKKKVLVVTGSRAEYGLLRPVLHELQKSKKLMPRLLVTGMHTLKKYGYTLNEVRREFTVDTVVRVKESDTMLSSLATEIRGIERAVQKERPDMMLILGDRDEPLAAALVASHLNIPLAHIHGGDITGPGVDESNRTLITKLSHLHFPATTKSAKRVKTLGEEAWRISVAGTPGLDLLQEQILSRSNLSKKLRLDAKKKWLLFVLHPVSHEEVPLIAQISSIRALESFASFERILIYPNSDSGSDVFIEHIHKLRGAYRIFKSLPRDEYLSLLKESVAIIGNSSSGIIEANFLGTPAVDIGGRQKGREHGDGVLHSSYSPKAVIQKIHAASSVKKRYEGKPIPSPYGSGRASTIIVSGIAKLIDHPLLSSKNL